MPDMQQEQGEMSAWEQVIQLAGSGNPQALAQIGQIAQAEIEKQQAEMQGMEGEATEPAQEGGLREMLQKAGQGGGAE